MIVELSDNGKLATIKIDNRSPIVCKVIYIDGEDIYLDSDISTFTKGLVFGDWIVSGCYISVLKNTTRMAVVDS